MSNWKLTARNQESLLTCFYYGFTQGDCYNKFFAEHKTKRHWSLSIELIEN